MVDVIRPHLKDKSSLLGKELLYYYGGRGRRSCCFCGIESEIEIERRCGEGHLQNGHQDAAVADVVSCEDGFVVHETLKERENEKV